MERKCLCRMPSSLSVHGSSSSISCSSTACLHMQIMRTLRSPTHGNLRQYHECYTQKDHMVYCFIQTSCTDHHRNPMLKIPLTVNCKISRSLCTAIRPHPCGESSLQSHARSLVLSSKRSSMRDCLKTEGTSRRVSLRVSFACHGACPDICPGDRYADNLRTPGGTGRPYNLRTTAFRRCRPNLRPGRSQKAERAEAPT